MELDSVKKNLINPLTGFRLVIANSSTLYCKDNFSWNELKKTMGHRDAHIMDNIHVYY